MLGDGAFNNPNIMGSLPEMTYGGALSFMRRKYTRDLSGIDLVVSGIPFDLAVTYRSGARLGPRAIREGSVQLAELSAYPWGFNPFDIIAVADYGDCFLDPHNPMTVKQTIIDHIRNILNHGALPLTFGGDHYITYPILCAMAEKYGKSLSIIHFDAHCDTWPDDNEESLNHGTMFYKAIKNGIIDPKRSVQIGIRTWNDNFMGVNILDSAWVNDNGWAKVVNRIDEIVGNNPTYLTFDIDGLDPAFAPGTGTPVVGGLSTHTALSIIRNLKQINLIGADVVEVAPCYDHSEITAIAAAQISLDIIALVASKRL